LRPTTSDAASATAGADRKMSICLITGSAMFEATVARQKQLVAPRLYCVLKKWGHTSLANYDEKELQCAIANVI